MYGSEESSAKDSCGEAFFWVFQAVALLVVDDDDDSVAGGLEV